MTTRDNGFKTGGTMKDEPQTRGATPGPWACVFTGPHSVTRDGIWEIGPVTADGAIDRSRVVAETADDNEDNARLLAAAPDLYEALKVTREQAYRAMVRCGSDPEFAAAAVASADAALKKAEGRA